MNHKFKFFATYLMLLGGVLETSVPALSPAIFWPDEIALMILRPTHKALQKLDVIIKTYEYRKSSRESSTETFLRIGRVFRRQLRFLQTCKQFYSPEFKAKLVDCFCEILQSTMPLGKSIFFVQRFSSGNQLKDYCYASHRSILTARSTFDLSSAIRVGKNDFYASLGDCNNVVYEVPRGDSWERFLPVEDRPIRVGYVLEYLVDRLVQDFKTPISQKKAKLYARELAKAILNKNTNLTLPINIYYGFNLGMLPGNTLADLIKISFQPSFNARFNTPGLYEKYFTQEVLDRLENPIIPEEYRAPKDPFLKVLLEDLFIPSHEVEKLKDWGSLKSTVTRIFFSFWKKYTGMLVFVWSMIGCVLLLEKLLMKIRSKVL